MALYWDDGTSLYHHGIPGMKWGVRRWQNPDGSYTPEGKIRYGRALSDGDVVIKRGHRFERVHTPFNNREYDSFKSKRLYVSDDAREYLNDYFIKDFDNTKIQTIIANRNMTFAGETAINNILNQIGEAPLRSIWNEDGSYNTSTNGTDRDFLLNRSDVGERFIIQAIKNGYSGIRDPVDDLGIGFSYSAKILFDLSNVTIDEIRADKF